MEDSSNEKDVVNLESAQNKDLTFLTRLICNLPPNNYQLAHLILLALFLKQNTIPPNILLENIVLNEETDECQRCREVFQTFYHTTKKCLERSKNITITINFRDGLRVDNFHFSIPLKYEYEYIPRCIKVSRVTDVIKKDEGVLAKSKKCTDFMADYKQLLLEQYSYIEEAKECLDLNTTDYVTEFGIDDEIDFTKYNIMEITDSSELLKNNTEISIAEQDVRRCISIILNQVATNIRMENERFIQEWDYQKFLHKDLCDDYDDIDDRDDKFKKLEQAIDQALLEIEIKKQDIVFPASGDENCDEFDSDENDDEDDDDDVDDDIDSDNDEKDRATKEQLNMSGFSFLFVRPPNTKMVESHKKNIEQLNSSNDDELQLLKTQIKTLARKPKHSRRKYSKTAIRPTFSPLPEQPEEESDPENYKNSLVLSSSHDIRKNIAKQVQKFSIEVKEYFSKIQEFFEPHCGGDIHYHGLEVFNESGEDNLCSTSYDSVLDDIDDYYQEGDYFKEAYELVEMLDKSEKIHFNGSDVKYTVSAVEATTELMKVIECYIKQSGSMVCCDIEDYQNNLGVVIEDLILKTGTCKVFSQLDELRQWSSEANLFESEMLDNVDDFCMQSSSEIFTTEEWNQLSYNGFNEND